MRYTIASVLALLLAASPGLAEASEKPAVRLWELFIQQFEAQDKENPPPEKPVLFTGSSSIRMWPVEDVFAEYKALNRGFGGSVYADLNHFYERIVLPYAPRAIVIYSGDNDVASGLDADETFHQFQLFADRVAADLPGVPLYVLAIKPSNARWDKWPIMAEVNKKIAAYADAQEHAHYVDTANPMFGEDEKPNAEYLMRDRLHLNEKGYEVWEGIVRPILEALP